MYCTRFSRPPSCSAPRKRSNTPAMPRGVSSHSIWPHSFTNATATSTESSVACASSRVSTCSARNSCATPWFTRCAMNLTSGTATTLLFRLYAFRNASTMRRSSRSPTSGSLVFSTATSAAYTGV